MNTAKDLFSYRKHWAQRFGVAPLLPMSREEMNELGWDSFDIIIVTGDAYIDHPSFGMALIGRLLESQGFRVGIIAQPDWQSTDEFKKLGKPNLSLASLPATWTPWSTAIPRTAACGMVMPIPLMVRKAGVLTVQYWFMPSTPGRPSVMCLPSSAG